VHRIGRVGRAGREGTAITLADPRESRLLQQFERQTKRKIEIAQVPTVADLRARRLEMTRASLREAVLAGGLDHYRVAVESLAQEHSLMDIALAAFKLAHQAAGGEIDQDQEEPRPAPKAPAQVKHQPEPRPSVQPRPPVKMARIYVGVGRNAEVLPQNITGAITAEGMKGTVIGAIEITDKYSTVELPEDLVEEALRVLKNGTIKGKKFVSRRFVEAAKKS
jgi:ATP-dependent RNA helicase DeaD